MTGFPSWKLASRRVNRHDVASELACQRSASLGTVDMSSPSSVNLSNSAFCRAWSTHGLGMCGSSVSFEPPHLIIATGMQLPTLWDNNAEVTGREGP
ncbi:MAG: hypothetical protein QOC67_5435 [Pseudonocardiales bacterium]|nr:hypothetical protein [Pseudonocardiales bacterium]